MHFGHWTLDATKSPETTPKNSRQEWKYSKEPQPAESEFILRLNFQTSPIRRENCEKLCRKGRIVRRRYLSKFWAFHKEIFAWPDTCALPRGHQFDDCRWMWREPYVDGSRYEVQPTCQLKRNTLSLIIT